ncbi:MAG: nucleotide exchange factor GrpE [Myxococcales bacterium]|nr:nucleotide exchange factor GrpE [Myxococcales bacterium]
MTDRPPERPPAGTRTIPKSSGGLKAELDSLLAELEGLDIESEVRAKADADDDPFEIDLDDAPAPAPEPERPPAMPPQRADSGFMRAPPRPGTGPQHQVPPLQPSDPMVPLLKRELELARQELEAWKSKAVKAATEFDAIRKRLQKEKSDAAQFGNEQLVRDLLPVLDTLSLAIDHAGPERNDKLASGVKMTLQMFLQVLARSGVESFGATEVPFDPKIHQSMARVTVPGMPPGLVAAVGQRGYTIHGRLLRPALVTVTGGETVAAPPDAFETPPPEPAPTEALGGRRRSTPDGAVGGLVAAEEGAHVPASLRAPTQPAIAHAFSELETRTSPEATDPDAG